MGLTKRLGLLALDDVDLTVPLDCYVALLGASRSGKTTVCRHRMSGSSGGPK